MLALPTAPCGVVADASVRESNARLRAQRIKLLRSVGGVVEIVYRGRPLHEPIDAGAIGIHVAHAASPGAVLILVDDGSDSRCTPFVARVDDSLREPLGRDAHGDAL